TDYSAEIADTFDKFEQGAAKDYRVSYRFAVEMNHVEAQILDFVAELNPDLFGRLAGYHTRHAAFIDETVAAFDREIHFYLAYLDYTAKLKAGGLQFCYPDVSASTKEVSAADAFDLALAQTIGGGASPIVCNDF